MILLFLRKPNNDLSNYKLSKNDFGSNKQLRAIFATILSLPEFQTEYFWKYQTIVRDLSVLEDPGTLRDTFFAMVYPELQILIENRLKISRD